MCHGEWIPCSSWKLHPAVASTSPKPSNTLGTKSGLFLKNWLFFFGYSWGLLCGMVSGSPVDPGNYTQQWPLQAPVPSSMLGTKSGLFLKNRSLFGILGASVWHGEWIPCSSWKLHPTVASTSPSPFKHAWNKNRPYFLKIGCFLVVGILGASVWRGEWSPCSSWKLHPAVASTSPSPFKHAWDKNRAYFLKVGCFFVFGILGASVCHGEWIPCSSWKLHPAVASTSPKPFKHAWDKIGPIS